MSSKVATYIARYVAVHDAGNPQLRLEKFTEPISRTCFFCDGKFPALKKVKYVSGLVAATCDACLEAHRSTTKKVLGVI